jgi:beta-lactamase class A
VARPLNFGSFFGPGALTSGRPPRPPRSSWIQPLLLLLRLIVMGAGLGVLAGTGLRLLAPHLAHGAGQATAGAAAGGGGLLAGLSKGGGAISSGLGRGSGLPLGSFEPRQELTALSARWQQLSAAQKDLQASAFLLVLDDGRYAALNPDRPQPAASSIKTPILLAGLEDVDSGKLAWNKSLPLTKEVVGGGAGWMGGKPVGTRFPFHEAATEMIRVSDNSATNLLIKELGGKEQLNTRFRSLGFTATVVNNWLPDLEGTNTTSSRDLARSIALVDTGERLSPRARDLFREIMASSRTNTMIPLGLLKGFGKDSSDPDAELLSHGITVYNKTGDIGIAYADAALIQLPDGKRAVAAFMVKGPFNDGRSTDLIRAMATAATRTLVTKATP